MFAPSPRRSSKSFFQNLSSCTNQAWFMQKDHFNLEQDAWPACPEPQWEVVGDGATSLLKNNEVSSESHLRTSPKTS